MERADGLVKKACVPRLGIFVTARARVLPTSAVSNALGEESASARCQHARYWLADRMP